MKFIGPELADMFNESGNVVVDPRSVCPGFEFLAPDPLPWGRNMAALECLRFLEPGARTLNVEGAPWSVGGVDPPPWGWNTPLAKPGSSALGPEHGDEELGSSTLGSEHKFD